MSNLKILFVLVYLFQTLIVNILTTELRTSKIKLFNCTNPKDFQCLSNNKCIKPYQICDGYPDCLDKSDETGCNFCNRTFNNEQMNRVIIHSPVDRSISNLHCFYEIVNVKPDIVIGIRLRKFSVGKYDSKINKCLKSWIEIKEFDLDEMDKLNNGLLKENRNEKLKKDISGASYGNNLNDFKSMLKVHEEDGKFCGNLHNLGSSFYSNKQKIILKYNRLVDNIALDEQSFQDTYEFEIIFYSKESLEPILYSKLKYQQAEKKINFDLTKINYGTPTNTNNCNRIFTNCSSQDNEACVITTQGYPGVYLKSQKCQYIIQNDLNEKLVILNDNIQIDSTICHFNNSLYNELSSSYFCDPGPRFAEDCKDYLNIYTKNSKSNDRWLLVKKICGMGRMPKIISSKKTIILEFISSTEGIFANSGFLFYVLTSKIYSEKFTSLNTIEIKNQAELNSYKLLEKLTIDNCDSDMTQCSIVLNEQLVEDIYKDLTNKNDQFKIGYLFNINQYQPVGFSLKYTLKSSKFNTIAINLDRYQSEGDTCRHNFFSIESTDVNKSIPLIKLCNRSSFNQLAVKYFLIKTSDYSEKKNKDLVITYFNTNPTLNSKFNDFRLSYEYLNFDWSNYKNDTLCDFVYDLNMDTSLPLKGVLTNPKASIFYKTTESFLKCRYRLVARPNQYILIKINNINFNVESDYNESDECDNVYFTNLNAESTRAHHEKCSRLNKKLIIKELKHSWSSTPVDDIFDDYYDSDEINSSLNTKMCLCKTNRNMSIYYVSKYDSIEIEYLIKLENNLNDLKLNEFELSYEFKDRKCEQFLVKNFKSKAKAKFQFKPELNS
ncbi:unnamed protein product, partial [Brachionus calyciflorus]